MSKTSAVAPPRSGKPPGAHPGGLGAQAGEDDDRAVGGHRVRARRDDRRVGMGVGLARQRERSRAEAEPATPWPAARTGDWSPAGRPAGCEQSLIMLSVDISCRP